ncbi:hypothetical protein C1752_10953 [Acaryochloris thomasi RCC1774]|uniref:Uncharacterized protein n=1 Tax=Acaryochloris thomasi RCC1774 TaxID=1764569 RepID=A0A2W1JJT6_9CYAN|nr:hypothetical protein [Acaryochloris thomasi]PZD70524.1 hypothetical protein C1752_10953 [Acaryochloris thomasi RCC1774]
MLKQSVPLASHEFQLSQQLYVQQFGRKIALPAQCVGSLAVVWREEGQGYQLFSWELRSPLSSLLFETREYCCEAAVELGDLFDVDAALAEPCFGISEKIEELINTHLHRELIALSFQAA